MGEVISSQEKQKKLPIISNENEKKKQQELGFSYYFILKMEKTKFLSILIFNGIESII